MSEDFRKLNSSAENVKVELDLSNWKKITTFFKRCASIIL